MRHRLDISITAGGGHLWRLLDPFGQPIAESSTVAKDETTARANFDTAARAAGEVARAGRADPLAPTAALLARVASIVGHVEEAASPDGHPFDHVALAALLSDPTVVRWTTGMRDLSLMPVKRSQDAQEADPGTAPAGT